LDRPPTAKLQQIGRNGSDYTAAILGAALGVSVIEIWTDVDGVLSADPKAVASAFVLPQITYEEAMELSYFGAKVLHPAAIAPAVARRIPLLIKNTFHPEAPGTVISGDRSHGDQPAKGISSIAGLTLLTIRGLSMVEFPESPSDYFVRWHLAASMSSSSLKPHPSTRFVSLSARPTPL
jgi:bifunctional aspartokinase / homoserine dehydrogenase 1